MAGLKAEGAVLGTVDDGDTEKTPAMIRAGDGTPEYADEDGDQDQQHHDAPPATVVGLSGGVKAGVGPHKLKLLKFYMACEIIDFKYDVKELIVDHLFGRPTKDDDERVRLLYVALDDDEPRPRPRGDDDDVEPQQVNHELDEQGRLTVSAAGFVDVLHMRRCIEAFFDPSMKDVQDEDADDEYDRNFWVDFMAATGFVNRLWDVRRIIDGYLDAKLDLETRKATIEARLADLEQLLQTRADAVATGEFSLLF